MSKRPHRFEIELDPAFSSKTRYYFKEGEIVVEHAQMPHRSAVPTLAQWSGFWRLCDFLDLWKWKPEYNHFQCRDGQAWSVKIAYDKTKVLNSEGMNSYPSLESPLHERVSMDRFGLLLHFVDFVLLSPRIDVRDDFADSESVQ